MAVDIDDALLQLFERTNVLMDLVQKMQGVMAGLHENSETMRRHLDLQNDLNDSALASAQRMDALLSDVGERLSRLEAARMAS
tara:strand:+ start:4666 stop:4914 length:249 start_codon:yes stop_codon:yes gene_type:complete